MGLHILISFLGTTPADFVRFRVCGEAMGLRSWWCWVDIFTLRDFFIKFTPLVKLLMMVIVLSPKKRIKKRIKFLSAWSVKPHISLLRGLQITKRSLSVSFVTQTLRSLLRGLDVAWSGLFVSLFSQENSSHGSHRPLKTAVVLVAPQLAAVVHPRSQWA